MSVEAPDLLQHLLVGPRALERIAPQVQRLFAELFGRPYPKELWAHYFEDAPGLPAAGVAVHCEDALVGFGACLPLELEAAGGERVDLGLVATVMIDAEHRHGGQTYVELLARLVEAAEALGHQGLIAFPNEAAFLPMTRLAGFRLIDEAWWIDGPLDTADHRAFLEGQEETAFFSSRAWTWRLRRFDYRLESGRVMKEFEGQDNCLDVTDPAVALDWSGLHPQWASAGARELPPAVPGTLRLCWRALGDDALIERVRRSLLLSDVF